MKPNKLNENPKDEPDAGADQIATKQATQGRPGEFRPVASSKAGIVGSFPTANCRTLEALDETFTEITQALGSGEGAQPWAVNIIVSKMYARSNDDIDLILKHKPPIVITSLGNPKEVVKKVHEYGGLVYSDVINLYHSKKAILYADNALFHLYCARN